MKLGATEPTWLIPMLLLLSLSACSTTELVNRWHDKEYIGPPPERILIIGLVQDDIKRRALEEGFVERLEKMGITGVSSFRLMPDPEDADQEEELKAVVRQANADSILIARLQGIDKEETYIPPRTEWVPFMGLGYGYYGYYSLSYHAVYRPGYTRLDTVVRLETKVFSTDDDRLLWAGHTESFNPDSTTRVIRELADVVVRDMQKSGLL